MEIRDCEILPYNEIFLLLPYASLEQVIRSELFGAKTTHFVAVNRETNCISSTNIYITTCAFSAALLSIK